MREPDATCVHPANSMLQPSSTLAMGEPMLNPGMFPRVVAILSLVVLSGLGVSACSDDGTSVPFSGADGTSRGGTDAAGGGADASDGSGESADGGNLALDVSITDTASEEDTSEPEGADCIGILDCVNSQECDTAACIDQCVATGTPDAQVTFEDFFACLGANCQDADTQAEFQECQLEFCGDELSACTGQDIGSGDLTCEEVFECSTGCRDQACVEECLASGSAAGQAEYSALVQCAIEPCGGSGTADALLACFEEECPDEFGTCFPGDM